MIRYLIDIIKLNKRFKFFESHNEKLLNYINFLYDDDEKTRRFHSSYVFMLWNNFISHAFKRQNTISTFLIETKYIDQCNTNKNVYFLSQILKKLNKKVKESIKIRANNQSIIVLINNSNNYRRIKYILIQYYYIRKLIKIERVKFNYIFIVKMLTNDLIKSLKSQLFAKFIRMLKLILSLFECM